MAIDLFDRRINVYMYDSDGEEVGKILTPEVGPKPEIAVKGVLVANTYAVNNEVIVTNIERSIPVENVTYVFVEMFYGGAKNPELKKGMLFTVLYADQSKQPPDRQVCFHCIVAGLAPNILQQKCSIGKLNSLGLPEQITLNQLLKEVIDKYNTAVMNTFSNISVSLNTSKYKENLLLRKRLMLNKEPLYRMSSSLEERYKNIPINYYSSSFTLATVLDQLSTSVIDTEKLSESNKLLKPYYALNFYIDDNNLVVSSAPSYKKDISVEKETLSLSYVITAYRCGNVVYCDTLFDSRIHQDILIKLNRNAIVGRKVSGKLVPLSSETVYFRPIGGIQYAFSTTKDNIMRMQGVATKIEVVEV